jgi:inorganic pyrophosphatase
MIVVVSGARYIDIDAYACCAAYVELLNMLDRPAVAASTAAWNESITKSIRALDAVLSTDYASGPNDEFVVVDVSDPSQFDKLVNVAQVIEVFDHHPGFEQYWTDKIGENNHIEFIGAAATLIYEQWIKVGKASQMSKVSAELLAAAILDNTLNFGAGVTTERDKEAYKFLAEHASLDDEWIANYFTECQEAILADLPEALRNDTKFLKFSGLDEELCLGQMVVWDAKHVIANDIDTLASVLGGMRHAWMANVVSISEGRSYFVAQNDKVKNWAETLLGVKFNNSVATAGRLWLRKEVMKAGGGI